jgi:hypothetical protein
MCTLFLPRKGQGELSKQTFFNFYLSMLTY